MKFRPIMFMSAIIVTCSSVAANAESMEEQIERARSAAPSYISDDATVVVDGEVVVEGSNGWTCLPDTFPDDRAPMCNDGEWMEMLTAFGSQADFTADRNGISYMLQGEPAGSGVSNSDPYHSNPRGAHDYVETGPHLMIVVPKELLHGMTDDPSQGGPYVMWKDTPYAHIMIPVTE